MKACWIGILGAGVLVSVSPDESSIAVILDAEAALQPGPGCLLRVNEPHASGSMRFQLLARGTRCSTTNSGKRRNQYLGCRSQATHWLSISRTRRPMCQQLLSNTLTLRRCRSGRKTAEQRGRVQSLMQQLTNNRWELIVSTLKGQFDNHRVRKLAAQQARILEPLVVANARLQTEIYTILTIEQRRKLDEMRTETAGVTRPSFTEW